MEKVYTVEIKERSKTILFKNRVIRTPTTIDVGERQLSLLKVQLHQKGIENFIIRGYSEDKIIPNDFVIDEEFIVDENKEIIIEELCEEQPKTILEGLLAQDGKWLNWRNKMKRIIIFQENTSAVEMLDPDKSDLQEYTKNLYQVLNSGNVSLLTTPLSSLIIKPSKITSILVQEVNEETPPDISTQLDGMVEQQKTEEVKREEDDVDIVTDIDD